MSLLRRCFPYVVISTVVLTSCSLLPTEERTTTDVPVHELAVPDDLRRTEASVSYSRMLPGAPSRPALIAGRSALASGPDRPTVWRSSRGTAWEQVPLEPPVGGELVDLAADADDSVAVVAGTAWADGRLTAWALESSDGVLWSEVVLPERVPADPRVLSVVVVGGAAVLLVAAADGGWHAVGTGQDGAVAPLPEVADDLTRRAAATDAVGDRITVVADQGDASGAPAPVAYVSPDGGRSWNEPSPVAADDNAAAGVTGLTATGATLLATGWVRTSPDAPLRPAAWRSADGEGWTPEPVDLSEATGIEDVDVTLTSPSEGHAVLTVEDDPVVAVAERVGNRWEPLETTGRVNAQTPTPVLGHIGDRIVVAMSGRGTGLIGSMSRTGTWVEHGRNGEAADPAQPWRLRTTGAASVLSVVTSVQTVTQDSSSSWPREQRLAVDETGVIGGAEPVAGAPDAYLTVQANDEDSGANVALVPGEPDGRGVPWTVWHQAPQESEPTSSVLPTAGGDWVYDVTYGGGGWMAVGETQADLLFETRPSPAAWTSPDGRTWTQAELPPPAGLVTGTLLAVCPAPDGEVLAVGSGSAGGTDAPIAYRGSVDGGWTVVDTSTTGTRADLDGCTSTDGGVAVVGSSGGRDQVWEIGAGDDFTPVRVAPQGGAFYDVIDTPAGLAVVGTAHEQDRAGGVLDVRTGASDWTRVRVPVPSAQHAVVGVVGERVHTYWQTTTGLRGFGVDLSDLRDG